MRLMTGCNDIVIEGDLAENLGPSQPDWPGHIRLRVSSGEYRDLKPQDIALIVAAAASSKDQRFENVAVFPYRRHDEQQ